MKSYVKVALLSLLAISLFSSCDKPNETSENGGGVATKNYTETAFGMNLEMVYVEGGEFEMGATAEQGDEAEEYEYPVRTVKLDSYHIGKYEVTQSQWEKVMGTTLEEQRALSSYDEGIVGMGADYPMYYVCWEDVQEFCKKLSEKTGKQYVLPTEAQWEYAARGGNKNQHYKYAGSNVIDDVAWYGGNRNGRELHPVGLKQPNSLGLYDMSGNVVEWCSDWDSRYDKADDLNPQGPVEGSYRTIRGGSWAGDASCCRVSFRDWSRPGRRNCYFGFRVVMLP